MALLAGTGTAQAQNLLTIDDARLVETSGGPWMAGILVKLPSAPTAPVNVNYTTIAGSATPGSDYTSTSGVLTFSTSESTKIINVQIFGDTTPEWSPTLKQDEVFFIELDTTEIAQIKAAPFYAGGPIVWRYHSGSANVVPPTVGGDAIYTVDNLGVVHAMERGPLGGAWPTTPIAWNPVAVGAPTQNRSAAVPLTGGWRLFLGTDGGGVHAIDGGSGAVIWSRSTSFGTAQEGCR